MSTLEYGSASHLRMSQNTETKQTIPRNHMCLNNKRTVNNCLLLVIHLHSLLLLLTVAVVWDALEHFLGWSAAISTFPTRGGVCTGTMTCPGCTMTGSNTSKVRPLTPPTMNWEEKINRSKPKSNKVDNHLTRSKRYSIVWFNRTIWRGDTKNHLCLKEQ